MSMISELVDELRLEATSNDSIEHDDKDLPKLLIRAADTIIMLSEKAKTTESMQGEWIKIGGFVTPGGDPVWKCSICGKGMHVFGVEHNSYGADISDSQWIACPNCGARMAEGLRKD